MSDASRLSSFLLGSPSSPLRVTLKRKGAQVISTRNRLESQWRSTWRKLTALVARTRTIISRRQSTAHKASDHFRHAQSAIRDKPSVLTVYENIVAKCGLGLVDNSLALSIGPEHLACRVQRRIYLLDGLSPLSAELTEIVVTRRSRPKPECPAIGSSQRLSAKQIGKLMVQRCESKEVGSCVDRADTGVWRWRGLSRGRSFSCWSLLTYRQ